MLERVEDCPAWGRVSPAPTVIRGSGRERRRNEGSAGSGCRRAPTLMSRPCRYSYGQLLTRARPDHDCEVGLDDHRQLRNRRCAAHQCEVDRSSTLATRRGHTRHAGRPRPARSHQRCVSSRAPRLAQFLAWPLISAVSRSRLTADQQAAQSLPRPLTIAVSRPALRRTPRRRAPPIGDDRSGDPGPRARPGARPPRCEWADLARAAAAGVTVAGIKRRQE